MENFSEQKTNAGQGIGIAALVLGCIAFPISFIPCVNISAILFAVVGVVLGAIGLSQATRLNGAKGLNMAGLILSAMALLVIIAWTLALSNGIGRHNNFKNEIRQALKDEFSKDANREEEEAGAVFDDQLEQQLEELESDSLADYQEAGRDIEVEKLLSDYEKFTTEIADLSVKVKQKDLSAINQYASVATKAALLGAKLVKAVPEMTDEQVRKFEAVQKKYEEALRKASK